MADYKHTMTSTLRMDGVDISKSKPLRGKIIVQLFEDKMLKLGNTDLILGYWEENRNNSHWFGTVVAKHPDVDINVGDEIFFSFLKAKGSDRIVSDGALYIVLDIQAVILSKIGDGFRMYNDYILALPTEAVKHNTLEYEEVNWFYRRIAHSNSEGFNVGDLVYYWTDKIYELEGLTKQLDMNYSVIKAEGILYKEPEVQEGSVLLVEIPQEQKINTGIIIPDTVKKKMSGRGKVVKTNCSIPVDTVVYFRQAKGEKLTLDQIEYLVVKEQHIDAIYENN